MTDFAHAGTFCRAALLLLCATLAGGCGELAYKRGASAGDLETAKAQCKSRGGNTAATEQCLKEMGWSIQSLSSLDALHSDPVIHASVIPSDRRIENVGAYPAAKPKASDVAAPQKAPDWLDTFKISSWWKTGGGADALSSDTAACVAKLGAAHRPDAQTQRVTRGLLVCMKEKGWSGLNAP